MKVNIFIRKPFELGNFSLETVYSEIFKELKKDIEIKIIRLPFYNTGIIQRIFNMFFCYFNQTQINHIVGDITYCSFFMNKKKLITTIHDCGAVFLNTGIKKQILKYFLFKMPVNRSKKVICISESTKADLLKLNIDVKNKTVIIPNTVSKSFNTKKRKKRKDFNYNFLIIGTAPNKNIERIAASLKGIQSEVTIIGKLNDKQRNKLIESNISYKELDFALTEAEVIDEYLKSDILLFPSTFEGFGMPIVEANILGICVLTSNISSMPYVANDAAELVDPFDVESIRSGILKIINDKSYRESLIINGFKNAKRFNIETIATKYKELYNQI
jgi:glycosyltransferase involved in cell wall biosynthesis